MSFRNRSRGSFNSGGGFGYQENYDEGDYGYKDDQGYNYNDDQGYGGGNQWQQGNQGNRNRRNNFNQQYEERDDGWRDRSGDDWGGNDDGWYGGEGDGQRNYNDQRSSQWSRQDDQHYDNYDNNNQRRIRTDYSDSGFSGGQRRGRDNFGDSSYQRRSQSDYNNDGYSHNQRRRRDDFDDGNFSSRKRGRDDHYEDAYSEQKRGRFRDEPRQRPVARRDPHNVNMYDEYEEPYGRSDRSRPSRRIEDSRTVRDRLGDKRPREHVYDQRRSERTRHEEPRRSQPLRSLAPNFRSSDSSSRRSYSRPAHFERPEKSDVEDAIYEKHRAVTVEKEKRNCIGDVVQSLISALRAVSQTLATEEQPIPEVQAKPEEESAPPKIEEKPAEKTADLSESKETVLADVEQEKTENVDPLPEDFKVIDEISEHKEAEGSSGVSQADETKKEEKSKSEISENGQKNVDPNLEKLSKKKTYDPVLLGAIKCGENAMRILVGKQLISQIVVLSKEKPTMSLVERVKEALVIAFRDERRMKHKEYTLEIDHEKEYLVLKLESISGFQVIIRFTSPLYSPDYVTKPAEESLPSDALSEESCQEALIMLRRMRFFHKKLDSSAVALTVTRILLYLRSKEGWSQLPVWMILVLVQMSIETVKKDYQKSDKTMDCMRVDKIFIRCVEILSSGALLPSGQGIRDPCVVKGDCGSSLTPQDVEDITLASQTALRYMKIGKLRYVLDLPSKEEKEAMKEERERTTEEKKEDEKDDDAKAEDEKVEDAPTEDAQTENVEDSKTEDAREDEAKNEDNQETDKSEEKSDEVPEQKQEEETMESKEV